MKLQKKLTFLNFSAYRVVLFVGLLGIVIFAYFLGPMMWRFYIGTGNAFFYQSGALAVHYIDVGQGDAVVIQLPDGRVVMIDSGTEAYYPRVKNYLNTRILKGASDKINFLIATHSHDDHIGGFPKLLDEFDVDVVYRPHNKSTSPFDAEAFDDEVSEGEARGPLADEQVYEKFITSAYTYASVMFIEEGEEIFDENFSMYFHTPTIQFIDSLSESRYQDFNDISPIISLHYKNQYFVFTGDSGIKTENQFRDSAEAIWTSENIGFENLDVYLKVGHHGSNTSTSSSFLEFLKPDKAIISVGARNLYGHPHQSVVERLGAHGLVADDILETSSLGNIVIASDGVSDKMFFAFDDEADLSLLYVLASVVVFFVCFADFRKYN